MSARITSEAMNAAMVRARLLSLGLRESAHILPRWAHWSTWVAPSSSTWARLDHTPEAGLRIPHDADRRYTFPARERAGSERTKETERLGLSAARGAALGSARGT